MLRHRYLLIATSLVLFAPAAWAVDAKPAQQAYAIFKKYCNECHGVTYAKPGLNILDLDYLKRHDTHKAHTPRYIVPGKPAQSLIWKRVSSDVNPMPPAEVDLRPSKQEIAELRAWITAGAPQWSDASARKFKNQKSVLEAIADHLRHSDHPQFERYFTLTHLYNSPGVTDYDLRLYRAALSKLVNSLSWRSDMVLPAAVDEEKTIYAVDVSKLGWQDTAVWDKILKAYPYGLSYEQDKQMDVQRLSQDIARYAGTELPFVRADWFIANASQPPLYETILDLPKSAGELERQLGVHLQDDFKNGLVRRAGITTSGVSRHMRMLERAEPSKGGSHYYWRSYDFKADAGRRNVVRFPLGPDFKGNDFDKVAFRQDGGEIIFGLPNGLQGYLLVNAKDERIERGPIQIVRDLHESAGTVEVINGLSCMSCHQHGMISGFTDVIRDGNRLSLGQASQKVRDIFPPKKDMDALLEKDQQVFMDAVKQATGPFLLVGEDAAKNIDQFPEPIGACARLYNRDLTLREVATELDFDKPEELASRILGSRKLKDLGLGPLAGGAAIKRDDWDSLDPISLFQQAANELDRGVPLRN